MTAEIAVLNRNAVALAADSAVTLQLPEGPKIYQTNKLFTLSKIHPVGVMIYGAADFMRVPWETIIKQYRENLGSHGFRRLDDYSRDLFAFVKNNGTFFPRDMQRTCCKELASTWIRRIALRLRKAIEEKFKSSRRISEAEVRTIFRQIVSEDIAHLNAHRNLPAFSRTRPASLVSRYRKEIRAAMAELHNLTGAVPVDQLEFGCALAIMRDLYWHGESGIVIAGFGNDDFLPGLRCYKLDAIIDGKLRLLEDMRKRSEITTTKVRGSVIAFAQSEMVALFMNGVDSDYTEFVRGLSWSCYQKGIHHSWKGS